MSGQPRFLDAGDSALVVELGDTIDADINAQVLALDAALRERSLAGVVETVPTYRSLMVVHDPLTLDRDTLRREILALRVHPRGGASPRTRWRVPVLYDGKDLETVAAAHGLTADAVVALHAGAEYRVYMVGFAPGFVYLGGLPERLHTPRREAPRARVPAQIISIGGQQAAISPPLELPSGWHLLGRTPVRSYDPRRTERPFIFAAGDIVRFRPVSAGEYAALMEAAEGGAIIAEEA